MLNFLDYLTTLQVPIALLHHHQKQSAHIPYYNNNHLQQV